MAKPRLSQVIPVLGIVILLLSALADVFGLGRAPEFGWQQMLGVIVGIALIGVATVPCVPVAVQ